jgi:twinkle protein
MTDEIKMPEGFYCASDFPQATPIDQVAWGTGWNSFDEIFKMYPGQFTVVTGIAGHGKSTFLLNVITRIALLESKRSFLYVPENERHVVSILKRVWPSTEMSLQYFLDAQCWIQSQSHQYKQQPYQTLDWVLECAIHAVKHCGVQVLMIDPWNELERLCPRHMLMSDYIGQCLMMLKSFARTFEVSIFLVAHPTKSVNDKGGMRIPTLADIEGSMNWFNKCDNGLVIHREEKSTCVISAKVREIGAGVRGMVWFNVETETGKYKPVEAPYVPL